MSQHFEQEKRDIQDIENFECEWRLIFRVSAIFSISFRAAAAQEEDFLMTSLDTQHAGLFIDPEQQVERQRRSRMKKMSR